MTASLAAPRSLAIRIDPYHQAMGGFMVLLIACCFLLAGRMHLAGFADQLRGCLAGVAILAGVIAYCAWRGFEKLGETALLAMWAVLVCPCLSLLILAAGRADSPLVDARLAAIDGYAGFSTAGVVQWTGRFPVLHLALGIAYAALPLLILVALFVPVLSGHARDSRRFIISVIAAAGITAFLFAFFPAAGPWTVEGYRPDRMQSAVTAYLHLLKAGQWMNIDPDSGAVVSFPSFHVVLAILPVIALWCIRRARLVICVVAVLVCVSTVTTGWHYGIDVLGGVVVVVLSHWIARCLA